MGRLLLKRLIKKSDGKINEIVGLVLRVMTFDKSNTSQISHSLLNLKVASSPGH